MSLQSNEHSLTRCSEQNALATSKFFLECGSPAAAIGGDPAGSSICHDSYLSQILRLSHREREGRPLRRFSTPNLHEARRLQLPGWPQTPPPEEKQESAAMVEKKEDVRFLGPRKGQHRPAIALASRKVERMTVLVPAMHILTAGPRTRRLQAGNHGASGAGKPPETRSKEVAPRRKVGSRNRQVPGGHTSKVRCRSRCGASYPILQVARRAQGSFEPPNQTVFWPSSWLLRPVLSHRLSAHRNKRLLPRNLQLREPETGQQVARFPAPSTCRAAINPQARLLSA